MVSRGAGLRWATPPTSIGSNRPGRYSRSSHDDMPFPIDEDEQTVHVDPGQTVYFQYIRRPGATTKNGKQTSTFKLAPCWKYSSAMRIFNGSGFLVQFHFSQ